MIFSDCSGGVTNTIPSGVTGRSMIVGQQGSLSIDPEEGLTAKTL
jgi:hypothetical protein